MNLIVISSPNQLKAELEAVTLLFEAGMQTFHLRKPNLTSAEIAKYIKLIPEEYTNRVVVHKYSKLANRFNIKGIHGANLQRIPGKTLSCSCHSFAETEINKMKFDYMFLGPIYDSISKENYKSKFSIYDLENALIAGVLTKQIYALGGISVDKIDELKLLGVKGIAVLGALWKNFEHDKNIDKLIKNFIEIKEKCNEE
ncbi:MAG: thiamine phosphate synthase [Candidatus Kapaibacterium sp.]|jgi:thiamine-phosphate pyrophosphorylase